MLEKLEVVKTMGLEIKKSIFHVLKDDFCTI